MTIEIISPTGVQNSEKNALQLIERHMPKTWKGFAGLELVKHGQPAREFDLILLTNDRVLVVELKNWLGEIKSEGGYWFQKKAGATSWSNRGRSPVKVNENKARALKSEIESAISNGRNIYVASLVVLCANNKELNIPVDERDRVATIESFISSLNDAAIAKKFPLLQKHFESPLAHKPQFQLLFNQKRDLFRAKRFSHENYAVDDDVILRHPRELYKEYKSTKIDDSNAKALLRKWDFSHLGTDAPLQVEWANLILRESRINSFIAQNTDELASTLLSPISSLAANEVEKDQCELYVFPGKYDRLNTFLEKYSDKLNNQEKVALVKSLVHKFAILHSYKVAHRDIGHQSIWLKRCGSVKLSNFMASYFPETQSVGLLRDSVRFNSTQSPEQLLGVADTSPFREDVYWLGVVAYRILFNSPPVQEEGLYLWKSIQASDLSAKLGKWFEKSIVWEPKERWSNAVEMLDALNQLDLGREYEYIPNSYFGFFKATTKIRDYEATHYILESDDLEIFQGSIGDFKYLIKVWPGLYPDETKPSFNQELATFLERAKNIQNNPTEFLPKIHDVGLDGKKGLLYVRDWIEGKTLFDWVSESPSEIERLKLSVKLIEGMERLHVLEIYHGDLNPSNIIVKSADEGLDSFPIFIDTPDLKFGTQRLTTPAFSPENFDSLSTQEIDRYCLVRLVIFILTGESTEQGNDLISLPALKASIAALLRQRPSILEVDSLRDELEAAIEPEAEELSPTFEIRCKKYLLPKGMDYLNLLSDNGLFYVQTFRRNDSDETHITLSGPGKRLRLVVNGKSFEFSALRLEDITHKQFQHESNKNIGLFLNIKLCAEGQDDVQDLIDWVMLSVQKTGIEDDVQVPDEPSSDASYDPDQGNKVLVNLPARTLWKTLIEAEVDVLPEIICKDGVESYRGFEGQYLVPFNTKSTLEYGKGEQIELLSQRPDGELGIVGVVKQLQPKQGAMVVELKGRRSTIQVGDRYYLRSKAERSSHQRRLEAINRIFNGKAVIPDLPKYFERTANLSLIRDFPAPSDEELDSYSVRDENGVIFELNANQRQAFKTVFSKGPVSFLQGPPGTGKTTFIGVFVDYLINKKGVRNILIASVSHEAVNNALEGILKLAGRNDNEIDVVRVGDEQNLSETLEHFGVDDIQDSYRESFRSELRKRLAGICKAIGLGQEFIDNYLGLLLNLRKLDREIRTLESQIKETSFVKDETGSELHSKLLSRRTTLSEAAKHILGDDAIFSQAEIYPAIERHLLEINSIDSPAMLATLRKVFDLSDEWIEVLGAQSGNFAQFLARTRTVVAGTCVGVGKWNLGISNTTYDWVIIDEAAKATSSDLAVAMQVGRRVLLVGDHFQLPPLYKEDLRKEVSRKLKVQSNSDVFDSDFERAFESDYGKAVGATLTTQYRMSPAISALVSKMFYEPRGRRLNLGRTMPADFYQKLAKPFDKEVLWISTDDQGPDGFEHRDASTYSNNAEARVVVKVLRELLASEDFLKSLMDSVGVNEKPIGVITFYEGQVREIQKEIAKAEWLGEKRNLVKVGTVDSYQGKENRIIILSLVRNNPKGVEGFVSNPNRLNVAMSRAMDRLVIVGSCRMWSVDNTGSPLGKVCREVLTLSQDGFAHVVQSKNIGDKS